MDSIIELKTISDLSKWMGQEEPKHPLITTIDLSRMDFVHSENFKVNTGFYTILLKNLCPCALRYGRNYYDFQEGTLFFAVPNQVVGLEDPDATKDIYGWGLVFHPELVRGTSLGSKMKDYTFFSYNVSEALHLSEKEKIKLTEIVEDILIELELAREKLLGTSDSVSEIAYELGFEYPQYFSKMFRKNVGMSPAEFRNMN